MIMDTKNKNRIACSTSIASGFPLEKACADIASLGLRLIDILTIEGWAHVNPGDLADRWEETIQHVDGLLKEHDLTPIALNSMVGPKMHERSDESNARRKVETEALFRLMKKYDIGVAALQPPLNVDPELDENIVFESCLATLREQVAMAEAAGLQFALELHTRSPFETMPQVNRLLAAMPDAPLVYDPTHFVSQGINIKETGGMMDNARHVHIRDAAKGKLQAPYGQGEVDFDWICQALKDRGYAGHISIEYLGGKNLEFDVLDSAQRLYEKLVEYFPQ